MASPVHNLAAIIPARRQAVDDIIRPGDIRQGSQRLALPGRHLDHDVLVMTAVDASASIFRIAWGSLK